MRQENTLGRLVRAERQRRNWTLRQMSEKVGIPLSTLAKVEQDRLSLTYDKLQQMTARLGLTMVEFLAQGSAQPPSAAAITARRSPTSASSTVHVDTPNLTARSPRCPAPQARDARHEVQCRRAVGDGDRMRRARVRLHGALEPARPGALAEPAGPIGLGNRRDVLFAHADIGKRHPPAHCRRGRHQPRTLFPVTTALITLPPSGRTLLLLDTTRGGASSARLAVRITALHVRALLTDGSVALHGGDAVARSRHRGLPEADAAVVWRKPLGHQHAQARGFEERRGALQQQAILEHAAGQDD